MQLKICLLAIAMSAVAGVSYAGNLCAINPYTKTDAEKGKLAFDSHCALCHQYSMVGRTPGNFMNESPDIKLLSEKDQKFVDGNGGVVPPLVGESFFKKQQANTFVQFSAEMGGAANSWPTKDFRAPDTYFWIAAYVLYRNCGKM
jgi:hypothetical protein